MQWIFLAPDSEPAKPEIIENRGHQIDIKLLPTSNNNGPVTSYKVIVVNEDLNQDFDQSILTSYHEANRNDLSYYITAELNPKVLKKILFLSINKNSNIFRILIKYSLLVMVKPMDPTIMLH